MDPTRWPFTSVILSTLDKHEAAARAKAPTLLWAYGASLDRHEQAIMAMVEHRWLERRGADGAPAIFKAGVL